MLKSNLCLSVTVKYTDIDYKVLSDGALHVTEGKSPFNRLTYRYTPLMAYLLVPNHLLTSMWGKFLFMSMDMFVAYWIDRILSLQFEVAGFPNISENQKMARSLNGGEYQTETRSHVMKYVCLWMFNPFTANVSTRGNAESVVALFVVLSLYLLFRGKLFLGSVVYAPCRYPKSISFSVI
jgi:phosphatidylinositol glycan class M